MIVEDRTKENKDQVFDAVEGNWVDRHAPRAIRPYLRLSRADRPIGTWLLLLPCWWGLILGILSDGLFSPKDIWIFFGCAIGAFLMRGAGCTWNDITDRDIDRSVERTKSRPIPSGQVSVLQAGIWMVAQALSASIILFSFNQTAIIFGLISLLPVATYPFAKRFTWWPQIFLGIAFNWGILLAFVAHSGKIAAAPIFMYLGAICWTLFYDTIYAHQDREDDALIGVKSTARLFGDQTVWWLWSFTAMATLLIIFSFILIAEGRALVVAVLGVFVFSSHLAWQIKQLNLDDQRVLLRLFKSNRNAGLLLVIFLVSASIIRT